MPKVVVTGDMNISGLARALQKSMKDAPLPKNDATPWTVVESTFNSWLADAVGASPILSLEKPRYLVAVLSPRLLTDMPDLDGQIEMFLQGLSERAGSMQVLCTALAVDPMLPQPLFETLELQKIATRVNERLAQFQKDHTWFFVLDFPAFVSTHGLNQLTDRRYEMLGRMFLSPKGSELFAEPLKRALLGLTRTPKKVLVLDLDNTMWGGILGEDGPDGIKCGGEGVGYAFLRFHRAIARLKRNGILLAICSKNNEADALAVFKNHPDLGLRIEDFVAHRINWLPKSENLKSMAEELNLGIDSFVFFDDSAFECEHVRQVLPKVDVIQAPSDPSDYVKALNEYPGFDTFRVTEEDRSRSKQYLDEAKRQNIKRSVTNLEEFYTSLDMKATLSLADESSFARVHQLVWKTNQFNLTTRRYEENELRDLLKSPDYSLYVLRLSDKLGESGITGLVIVKKGKQTWEVENLLLSCRIIGRTVEFGLIRFIAEKAKSAGATELEASFIRSDRNQVAAEYLPQSGFSRIASSDRWKMPLEESAKRIPKDYVHITEA
jgi:FkbH-like protein